MGYWIDPTLGYCEGDAPTVYAIAVPKRPDYTCLWVNGAWTGSTLQAKKNSEAAQANLDAADITMLRVADAVALGKTTYTTADVVAFVNWRVALRNDVKNGTTTAGPKPPYPAGT